jgi:hypothetical protein
MTGEDSLLTVNPIKKQQTIDDALKRSSIIN